MTDKVHVSICRAFDVRFKFRVGGHVTRYGAVKLRKNMGANYISPPMPPEIHFRWPRGDNSGAQKNTRPAYLTFNGTKADK